MGKHDVQSVEQYPKPSKYDIGAESATVTTGGGFFGGTIEKLRELKQQLADSSKESAEAKKAREEAKASMMRE